MKSIFFCHSSVDKPFVNILASRFKDCGFETWVDESQLNIGESLIQTVSEAIDRADYFIVVLSKNSIKSKWVSKELNLAMDKEINGNKIFVIPLLIEDCQIPPSLKDKLFANFMNEDNYETEFKKLLNSLGFLGYESERISFKYFIWYDIIDSIRYDPNLRRINKYFINTFISNFLEREKANNVVTYSYGSDMNDSKDILFSDKAILSTISYFITGLLQSVDRQIKLRMICCNTSVFNSKVTKKRNEMEVEGQNFWEHIIQIRKHLRKLEDKFKPTNNILLLLEKNHSTRIDKYISSNKKMLWNGELLTSSSADTFNTKSYLWSM